MDGWVEAIEANLRDLRGRLAAAAERSGRGPDSVRLMAVTKTVPAERVQAALDLGVRLVGENRVQEARQKLAELRGPFEPHLVGHLQGNKAAAAVELFLSVDSVDGLDLSRRLSRLAAARGARLRVMWEVNTSGEPAKFGFEAQELERLAPELAALPALEPCGLLTLGPVPDSGRDPRPCFRALRALRDRLQDLLGRPLPELNMGMSGDFECAVEEGATVVRIGTALFGPRRA